VISQVLIETAKDWEALWGVKAHIVPICLGILAYAQDPLGTLAAYFWLAEADIYPHWRADLGNRLLRELVRDGVD
jgi:hypothetical protein